MQVGDKVIYAHRNDRYGNPCRSDPLIGTDYFCEGKIIELYPENHPFEVHVRWDNGTQNAYFKKDLELADYSEIAWEV